MDEQPVGTGIGELETGVLNPSQTLRPEQFFTAVELPGSLVGATSGSLTRKLEPPVRPTHRPATGPGPGLAGSASARPRRRS